MVLPAAPWPLFYISISIFYPISRKRVSLHCTNYYGSVCISRPAYLLSITLQNFPSRSLFFALCMFSTLTCLCASCSPTVRHAGVIMAARKISRSVDGDGNGKLDRQELGMLVQELRASMGAHLLNGPAVSILSLLSVSLFFWRPLFLCSFGDLCFSVLLAISVSLLFWRPLLCLFFLVVCLILPRSTEISSYIRAVRLSFVCL